MIREIKLPRDRMVDFSKGCLVMGIINCTPDSFYLGSRKPSVSEALETAKVMIDAGVHLLDVGGESSRPGASYVDADSETSRVVPVVEGIRKFSGLPLSVDTRKYAVAKAAVEAGADMINDISSLSDDLKLGPYAAETGLPVILMHKRGTPETMQIKPFYEDPVGEVLAEIEASVERAERFGIVRERIIIDPGIGFGKRYSDNLLLLQVLERFRALGLPLLVGVSRKSFIGRALADAAGRERDAGERLAGTLGAHAWCIMKGAQIVRVHDVRETMDVLKVLTAIAGDFTEQGN
ncbi:MAG: dihydropteroate synthase [Spirochaetales bacterium]|nr:MAG: dihydropteroate synthase [Spirochaetales bacterium]